MSQVHRVRRWPPTRVEIKFLPRLDHVQQCVEIAMREENPSPNHRMNRFSSDFFKPLNQGIVDVRGSKAFCKINASMIEISLSLSTLSLFVVLYELTDQFIIIDSRVGLARYCPRINEIIIVSRRVCPIFQFYVLDLRCNFHGFAREKMPTGSTSHVRSE